jgi:hypothetical protein
VNSGSGSSRKKSFNTPVISLMSVRFSSEFKSRWSMSGVRQRISHMSRILLIPGQSPHLSPSLLSDAVCDLSSLTVCIDPGSQDHTLLSFERISGVLSVRPRYRAPSGNRDRLQSRLAAAVTVAAVAVSVRNCKTVHARARLLLSCHDYCRPVKH